MTRIAEFERHPRPHGATRAGVVSRQDRQGGGAARHGPTGPSRPIAARDPGPGLPLPPP